MKDTASRFGSTRFENFHGEQTNRDTPAPARTLLFRRGKTATIKFNWTTVCRRGPVAQSEIVKVFRVFARPRNSYRLHCKLSPARGTRRWQKPGELIARCPRPLPRGQPLELFYSFDGNAQNRYLTGRHFFPAKARSSRRHDSSVLATGRAVSLLPVARGREDR